MMRTGITGGDGNMGEQPKVLKIETHACGCERTHFVGGNIVWSPCVGCALEQAGQLLSAAGQRIKKAQGQ